MGASSKSSARLVTSTIVLTVTDPEPSTATEEPTETGGSSDLSTAGSFAFASSLPVALPISFPTFTTPATDSKASPTPFLSAAAGVVTATQTVIVFPSSSSTVSQTTQVIAQSHGLSRKNIIIISSAAGGGVLLALLAGITFCLIWRRKRRARERSKYQSSYGSPAADPFNASLKGANMSQEKSYGTHNNNSTPESRRYMLEHGNAFYYDGYANNVVGERQVSAQVQDRVVMAPKRSPGRGNMPLLRSTSRMESPIDPELDEHRRLNGRPMRMDETPPSSASPLGAGYGFGREDMDGYSPDEYGVYAPYGYGYAIDAPSPPIVHPAISLADATPARTPVSMHMPAPMQAVNSSAATMPMPQQMHSASKAQQQQQHTALEASSSFEYPSWLRMGLDSGAIASAASTSSIPVAPLIPAKRSTKRRSAIALTPIVIPEYTPRARAATVSTSSGGRTPARRPEPTTPLPAPPPQNAPIRAPMAPPSVQAMPPAQVASSTTQASIVTRKSTKGRRSVKRGKGSYQALDSPAPSPVPDAGFDATKRADSPSAYSDGGDSASMYSQVSASMYSQASASTSAHANDHRTGLELSQSTILAFPLIMRQNPPPLPHSHLTRGPASPSMSPSISLPNDVFGTGTAQPRQDVRATVDAEGDADDTVTMRVAGLIQSRARQMRSVAPPERSGSIVSHIERAGSIKPAFGPRAVHDGRAEYGTEEGGTTKPLRIGAGRVAGAQARMARMKRAVDATGPGRPLQDGTNVK
ncbi:hypothetical protein D9619_002201 [Psilocybe cf. subviscida]|uniref:Uncharacterized protein n=1 Tax=Psilocybe cf. subviscida TaxID=2480587 RepID=A0A8H5F3H0_9AGAR|nr:hypothetical protein D9619_002201 [Psilocybe cf. subviscida]